MNFGMLNCKCRIPSALGTRQDEAVLVPEEDVVVCALEPEVETEPEEAAEVVTALVETPPVETDVEVDVLVPDDADVEPVEAVVDEDVVVAAAAIDVVEAAAPAIVCVEAAVVEAALAPAEPVLEPPAVEPPVEEPE